MGQFWLLEKYLTIAERQAEFKTAYSFYLELLAMYKSGEVVHEGIIKRESELGKPLQFLSCEKYMKQALIPKSNPFYFPQIHVSLVEENHIK